MRRPKPVTCHHSITRPLSCQPPSSIYKQKENPGLRKGQGARGCQVGALAAVGYPWLEYIREPRKLEGTRDVLWFFEPLRLSLLLVALLLGALRPSIHIAVMHTTHRETGTSDHIDENHWRSFLAALAYEGTQPDIAGRTSACDRAAS